MKKKMILFLCCIFFGMLFIVAHVIPVRPVVTVKNNTSKSLYIYMDESIYGVEPEPDEVEEIVKSKPEVIAPGKEFKLTASFMSLIRRDAAIDIGWRMGGAYEYNSTGGGGQNFLLSSKEGFCSVAIEIQNGFNNSTLKNAPGGWCLKKLKSFRYQY